MRNLDKHRDYKTHYQPNDTYWGIGLEHETYLETNKLKQVTPHDLKDHKEPERYSVRYYDVYEPTLWEKAIDDLFAPDTKLLLPILINSHTFQKTDLAGEHPHTADRTYKLNPKFDNMTFHEWTKEQNPDVFRDQYDKTFTFDGDSIEFKTQHFYRATVKQTLQELSNTEKEWMRALNSLPREGILKLYAPLQLAAQNYPFATYLTNLKHNAMFHNGTIHINLTLPTKLDHKGEIQDKPLFIQQHRAFARAIQWLSPLLVALYGTPDPLSESKQFGTHYAAGSQRVAVSRYTGLGTYDTDAMEEGILLTKKRADLADLDWYEAFHRYANYIPLQDIGLDLNFHKYDGHGLEIRFLESMPAPQVEEILTFLPYLADFSLEAPLLPNPKKSPTWHRLAEHSVHLGKGYRVDVSVQHELFSLFGIAYLSKEPLLVQEVFHIIKEDLLSRFQQGRCVSCMIHGKDKVHDVPEHKQEEPIASSNESEVELASLAPLASLPSVPPYAAALSVYAEPAVSPPLSPPPKKGLFACCS
jgi:hypothetical protein